MPVNLVDIQKKLGNFSRQARARKEQIADQHQEAANLMREYADRLDDLRDRVDLVAEVYPRLRCAVPVSESLNAVVPSPEPPKTLTLLAADGSQINPSRHARVEFCVINIGVVKMVRGSGDVPCIYTQSHLLDYDSVFLPGGGMISEGMVALKRDLREREALLKLLGNIDPPALSMTDGPLELYREPQATQEFSKTLDHYLDVLGCLRNQGLMTLGYVDKPGGGLIGRLLELVRLSDVELHNYQQRKRRYAGVHDTLLFGDLLCNPGDRSAVFRIYSQTALKFTGDIGLHFFYLNVGQIGKPHLARVEIPAWVARDKTLVGFVQAVLVEQAQILGSRPYPYLLHRAHEEALVSIPEHQHVEDMIVTELERQGIPVDEKSYKQYHKDLPTTKTRYHR